jgi:hypothetical protein
MNVQTKDGRPLESEMLAIGQRRAQCSGGVCAKPSTERRTSADRSRQMQSGA